MAEIKLKPCPFCVGKAETFPLDKCDSYGNHERLWYSECGECFARSGYYNTEGEAAIAWNTRTSGWIPCSERMPENADDPGAFCPKYYVKTRYGVTEGWYNPDFDVWFVLIWYYTRRFLDHEISLERGDVPKVCTMLKSDVTHWMPLPEPPEIENNME